MSDLEDLGDIADQCALGSSGLSHRAVGKRPFSARCGSADHMKPGHVRVFRSKNGKGKLRTVCKLCEAARRKANTKARRSGGYSAEGYPL